MNKGKSWVVLLSVFLAFLIFSSFVHSGDKDELDSLRGLKGIYVLIENLPPDIEEKGGLTKDQIRTDIELKLRLAGIKVIPKEDRFGIPGWPFLYVNIDARRNLPGLIIYSVSISLEQQVNLSRDPKIRINATTWSSESHGSAGEAGMVSWIRNSIKDHVDRFINDYLSVNPKEDRK